MFEHYWEIMWYSIRPDMYCLDSLDFTKEHYLVFVPNLSCPQESYREIRQVDSITNWAAFCEKVQDCIWDVIEWFDYNDAFNTWLIDNPFPIPVILTTNWNTISISVAWNTPVTEDIVLSNALTGAWLNIISTVNWVAASRDLWPSVQALINANLLTCNWALVSATNKILTTGSLSTNVDLPTTIVATPNPLTSTYTKAVKVNTWCADDIYVPVAIYEKEIVLQSNPYINKDFISSMTSDWVWGWRQLFHVDDAISLTLPTVPTVPAWMKYVFSWEVMMAMSFTLLNGSIECGLNCTWCFNTDRNPVHNETNWTYFLARNIPVRFDAVSWSMIINLTYYASCEVSTPLTIQWWWIRYYCDGVRWYLKLVTI